MPRSLGVLRLSLRTRETWIEMKRVWPCDNPADVELRMGWVDQAIKIIWHECAGDKVRDRFPGAQPSVTKGLSERNVVLPSWRQGRGAKDECIGNLYLPTIKCLNAVRALEVDESLGHCESRMIGGVDN